MIHKSWDFLIDLDISEKRLLSSAIEISGLLEFSISEDCTKLIRFLTNIVGSEDYLSFLQWNVPKGKHNSIDKLENEYLNSLVNTIITDNNELKANKLNLAFSILDRMGLVWDKEILNEIYLSISEPERSAFIYGQDIRFSVRQRRNEFLLNGGMPNLKLLMYLALIPVIRSIVILFFRYIVKEFTKSKIIPIVCAIIIIRNERDYSFSSEQAAVNYICSFVDRNMEKESREMALILQNPETRYSSISKHKWQKVESYEKGIEQILSQRANDDGTFRDVNWNYSIQKEIVANNLLSKRRHKFKHAISDDIKNVIDKLHRDCRTNLKLNEYKGQDIIAMLETYTKWINQVDSIPLNDNLSEDVINSNIHEIVNKGYELLDSFSPFFHSLVDQYAFLFPDYQDSNNIAYNRLIRFINKEEKLRKEISDFSNTRIYGQFDEKSVGYVIELILSSLQDVTNYVTIQSDCDYAKAVIMINVRDFQEYVLTNFQSNLKEKAFYRRDNMEHKILVSVFMANNKIAIGLSNNGEPFTGEVDRVFEESYTFGENRGNGQGMYDAKQYMNHIQGDIQMRAFPNMEYPVRFVLLFPIITK